MTAGQDVILVAGFGRCGSTLVMHMLDRAGVPTIGRAPDYELRPIQNAADCDWLATLGGHAVKLLTPAYRTVALRPNPIGVYRSIWLDRDPVEQARSQIKLIALSDPTLALDRSAARAMAQSLRRDRRRARAKLRAAGPMLSIRFEQLLTDPSGVARLIASHVARGDPDEMAAAVLPRGPECQPDMRIESWLRATARPAA